MGLTYGWAVAQLRQRFTERQRSIRLRLWDGHEEIFGSDPAITITLRRPDAVLMLTQPTLAAIAHAYTAGDIDIDGPARDAVRLAAELCDGVAHRAVLPTFNWRATSSGSTGDRRVGTLYGDLPSKFFHLWLGRTMGYSSACFADDGQELDEAQDAKLDLVCRKLQLGRGERFLDIGCGWGALVIWAARHYGVEAVGITTSQPQVEFARSLIEAEGLKGRVIVRLQDFGKVPSGEVFDEIASVGLIERVGLKQLPNYFRSIFQHLVDDGLVMCEGVTARLSPDEALRTDASHFIERYVQPGGELPHVAHAMAEMAMQHLEVYDVEGMRPHYIRSVMHWQARLEANRSQAIELVGEQTYMHWQSYLAGCAHAFDKGWISAYQLLAAKHARPGRSRQPLTRDYMLESRQPAATPAQCAPSPGG